MKDSADLSAPGLGFAPRSASLLLRGMLLVGNLLSVGGDGDSNHTNSFLFTYHSPATSCTYPGSYSFLEGEHAAASQHVSPSKSAFQSHAYITRSPETGNKMRISKLTAHVYISVEFRVYSALEQ